MPARCQSSGRTALAAARAVLMGLTAVALVPVVPSPCLAGDKPPAAASVEAAAEPLSGGAIASPSSADRGAAAFDPIVPPVRRVMPKTPATLPGFKGPAAKPASGKTADGKPNGAKSAATKPAAPKANATKDAAGKTSPAKHAKDAKTVAPSASGSAPTSGTAPTKAAEQTPKPPDKATVKR